MSNESTTVQENKKSDLRSFISGDVVKEQIAKALPEICTPDRFLRVAMTTITKNQDLLNCSRDTFISCLLDCASLGIEPDGRRAHLIPFKNNKQNRIDCQLIIDYKGLVELVLRSGKIATIHADIVCENDEFEFNKGVVEVHRPNFKDRGKPYLYYAYAKMKDGSEKAEVMNLEDIGRIKSKSKAGNFGPWKTDFDEMAKKTVFRRLCKWLPLSPEDAQALQNVEKKEFDFDMTLPKPNFVDPETGNEGLKQKLAAKAGEK